MNRSYDFHSYQYLEINCERYKKHAKPFLEGLLRDLREHEAIKRRILT